MSDDVLTLYELVNPSDPVSFYAPNVTAARAVAILVGNGKMAVEDAQGTNLGGMLAFGSSEDADAALQEWFGGLLDDWVAAHRTEVCAALESCATVSCWNRELYDMAVNGVTDPEQRALFRATIDDRRRSSTNKITRYAWRLAVRVRDTYPPERQKLGQDESTAEGGNV